MKLKHGKNRITKFYIIGLLVVAFLIFITPVTIYLFMKLSHQEKIDNFYAYWQEHVSPKLELANKKLQNSYQNAKTNDEKLKIAKKQLQLLHKLDVTALKKDFKDKEINSIHKKLVDYLLIKERHYQSVVYVHQFLSTYNEEEVKELMENIEREDRGAEYLFKKFEKSEIDYMEKYNLHSKNKKI